ncbi:DinB family protein [Williamsia sp. CHRR-6]|uniref:DinB family protein n=1 Tax=Williamsia sp. CHRR-6 TaxID=2835871 RepID=UPI0027DBEA1B|nr:DinB family protein [Williamsia sp. CHRR-6]
MWKLDGLGECDIRRPLTGTGTNLLGLVRHLTMTEALYFSDVFGRPLDELLPWNHPDSEAGSDSWVPTDESRSEVLERCARVCTHTDATIAELPIDTPGFVPHWPRPHVTLFNVMVHVLGETLRHAGHADILREGLDGTTGAYPEVPEPEERDRLYWQNRCARIEAAAREAARRYPT